LELAAEKELPANQLKPAELSQLTSRIVYNDLALKNEAHGRAHRNKIMHVNI
jgi:hypothetical protein